MGSWNTEGSLPSGTTLLEMVCVPLGNGKVLSIGGLVSSSSGTVSALCFLYDPTTHTWSATGSLSHARRLHSAVVLSNGKVLVASGEDSSANPIDVCELYDPVAGTWSNTGSTTNHHQRARIAVMGTGDVLIVSGLSSATCEIYSVSSGTWSSAAALSTNNYFYDLITLPNGNVLMVGGSDGGGNAITSCQIYNVSGNSWSSTGSLTNPIQAAKAEPRILIQYNSNTILRAGGQDNTNFPTGSAFTEKYSISAGTWSNAGNLSTGRLGCFLCIRRDGTVMISGGATSQVPGTSGQTVISTSEVWNGSSSWSSGPSLSSSRYELGGATIPNGNQIIVGGVSPTYSTTLGSSDEYLDPLSLTLSLSDSVSESDSKSQTQGFGRTLTDLLTMAVTTALALPQTLGLNDAVVSSDSFNRLVNYLRTLTETVTMSVVIHFVPIHFLFDTINMSDFLSKSLPPMSVNDSLTLQDWISIIRRPVANIWTSLQ